MKPKNVKEIVVQYLKKNEYDGVCSYDNACSCAIDELLEAAFMCYEFADCVPAVKRRRWVDGKRQMVLVPVE